MKIRRLVELGLKAKGRQAMTEIDAQRDRDIYDLIGSFTEKSMSDIQVRFDGLKNSGLQFADLENLQRDIMSEPSRDGEDVRAKDAVLKIMELLMSTIAQRRPATLRRPSWWRML